jgi:hypothetical protein
MDELIFQADVCGSRVANGNLDNPLLSGLLEEAGNLRARKPKGLGDLFLGLIIFIIEAADLEEEGKLVLSIHG